MFEALKAFNSFKGTPKTSTKKDENVEMAPVTVMVTSRPKTACNELSLATASGSHCYIPDDNKINNRTPARSTAAKKVAGDCSRSRHFSSHPPVRSHKTWQKKEIKYSFSRNNGQLARESLRQSVMHRSSPAGNYSYYRHAIENHGGSLSARLAPSKCPREVKSRKRSTGSSFCSHHQKKKKMKRSRTRDCKNCNHKQKKKRRREPVIDLISSSETCSESSKDTPARQYRMKEKQQVTSVHRIVGRVSDWESGDTISYSGAQSPESFTSPYVNRQLDSIIMVHRLPNHICVFPYLDETPCYPPFPPDDLRSKLEHKKLMKDQAENKCRLIAYVPEESKNARKICDIFEIFGTVKFVEKCNKYQNAVVIEFVDSKSCKLALQMRAVPKVDQNVEPIVTSPPAKERLSQVFLPSCVSNFSYPASPCAASADKSCDAFSPASTSVPGENSPPVAAVPQQPQTSFRNSNIYKYFRKLDKPVETPFEKKDELLEEHMNNIKLFNETAQNSEIASESLMDLFKICAISYSKLNSK